jgi:hypothetical protein
MRAALQGRYRDDNQQITRSNNGYFTNKFTNKFTESGEKINGYSRSIGFRFGIVGMDHSESLDFALVGRAHLHERLLFFAAAGRRSKTGFLARGSPKFTKYASMLPGELGQSPARSDRCFEVEYCPPETGLAGGKHLN